MANLLDLFMDREVNLARLQKVQGQVQHFSIEETELLFLGHFNVNGQIAYGTSPKITISGKYKNLMDENISARNNPGPGAYYPKIKDKIPDLRFSIFILMLFS